MANDELKTITHEIISDLVYGRYKLLVQKCVKSRLTSEDLRKVVSNYGRKLASPPDDTYQNLDAIQVKGMFVPTWSVRVPLWTEKEGRSDLTLELTITLGPEGPVVELDDLHVL